MLRVVIDATALPENRGGVGRYVDELVRHLPRLGVDTHVASQARDVSRYESELGRDHVHAVPSWSRSTAPRLAWEQVGLPLLARRLAPDVVHSPHYTMPLALNALTGPVQIVTLHDATFFSDPELHQRVKARFFRGWTAFSSRHADALVAPSQATRAELIRYTGDHEAPIVVIPHGVDHAKFQPATPREIRGARHWLGLSSEDDYVAFLGTLEPRKNVPALIRAFVTACVEVDRPPILVLAGGKGWDDKLDAALAEVPSRLTVLRPGFVPDELVPALLSGAQVVVYPAFGEGFGLPVLEAMACGAAVLTTRRLSLPEVGGDAVAYANSPDAADIAAALAQLLAEPETRRRLSTAAVARASLFTWEATARQHKELYESVSPG